MFCRNKEKKAIAWSALLCCEDLVLRRNAHTSIISTSIGMMQMQSRCLNNNFHYFPAPLLCAIRPMPGAPLVKKGPILPSLCRLVTRPALEKGSPLSCEHKSSCSTENVSCSCKRGKRLGRGSILLHRFSMERNTASSSPTPLQPCPVGDPQMPVPRGPGGS